MEIVNTNNNGSLTKKVFARFITYTLIVFAIAVSLPVVMVVSRIFRTFCF